PSRPPFSLVIASQTLYPCCAALPGSENSPVSGSEAPILIVPPPLLPLPAEPPLSSPPQPAATSPRTPAAMRAATSQRSLRIPRTSSKPPVLQTFAANVCNLLRRPDDCQAGGAAVEPRATSSTGSTTSFFPS